MDGSIQIITINNEDEFITLLEDCGINQDGTQEECLCTEDYNPVCVNIQDAYGVNFIIEFPNMCYAEWEGFTKNDIVACENTNLNVFIDCFEFVYPISIITDDGETTVINNYNEFEIVLFSNNFFDFVFPFSITQGIGGLETTTEINDLEGFINQLILCANNQCTSNCPTDGEPVCIKINEELIISYPNFCLAECDGFTKSDLVDCYISHCIEECEDIDDPVCVQRTNEYEIKEFANRCIAFCQGYTYLDIVDCEPQGNCEEHCPDVLEPVCIRNNKGQVETFKNFCFVLCAGYDKHDLVECE
jgi:hypothetical protein